MPVKVRFAPSPTGLLHVGNARTALLNCLFARRHDGEFLLRIDDTDAARSTREFEDAILRDLAWLGLAPDAMARQSARLDSYRTAFERLKASGHVYPAYETEAELERKRALLKARRLPPIYDRAALDPATRARWEAEGRRPHWRFKLSRTKIGWTDLIRGPVEIDTATQSDPVLLREGGAFLYTFPSVVDDVEMGISHVIRGEDLFAFTPIQVILQRLFGLPTPLYHHHRLIRDGAGKRLAKRDDARAIRKYRDDGATPADIRRMVGL